MESKIYVILASGQSLTEENVEIVRKAKEDKIIEGVIAISNTAKLAPWADAIVSHDAKWWRVHKDWALNLSMRKFTRQTTPGVELYVPKEVPQGCNSALMAAFVARDIYKARKIIFLGLDMHGTHFFGKHPEPLRNPDAERFAVHMKQFEKWSGCPIINCSLNSALKLFPIIQLEEALQNDS